MPKETPPEEPPADENGLKILSALEAPHWDEEIGIAVWGNVSETGTNGCVQYDGRFYCADAFSANCVYYFAMQVVGGGV